MDNTCWPAPKAPDRVARPRRAAVIVQKVHRRRDTFSADVTKKRPPRVTLGAGPCNPFAVTLSEPIELGQYREPLLGHIRSIVRSGTEAEDLLQEVLVKAHQSLDQLQVQAALSTWLFRIATHVSVDHLRKRGRRPVVEDEIDPDGVGGTDDSMPSLQALVEQREMSACIQRYVLNLPSDFRTVIMLHDLEGLTAAEIAAMLDISLANAKVRLHRARTSLKSALQAGCTLSCDCRGVLVCEPKAD
jgi:RNA polymerase sigma-70 factor, ECF subfamily